MSNAFLLRFSELLVERLRAEALVEVTDENAPEVAVFVANHLGDHGSGRSLLSSTLAALMACPEVDEVYADLETLGAVVDSLDPPRV